MPTQKDEILKMIIALKSLKYPVSKIESELSFSNGLIGKAAKGTTELSDDKFKALCNFFTEKSEVKEPPKEKTKIVSTKEGLKEKPSDEKNIVATDAMQKINKDFGDGTIMFFGSKPNTDYQTVSTGSLSLDHALGIGGLPRGRMVEIFGAESSGKTTIALQVIADAQRQGLKCLLIDAENSFDPEYAAVLGVELDKISYCQPSYGEEGFEVADRQITAGEADVVVIDSVAAMIPKAELEGEMGDNKMGLHARLMSQVCRKLVGTIAKKNCLLIFINQIRNKIGVMWGNPEVTTGGMALQFYASVRLNVSRSTTNDNSIMNGDVKEGNKTTVKVIKNKCAPPFRSAVFNIIYGKGVDRLSEIVDVGVETKVIDKSGSWFSYNNSKLGQGKDAVKEVLESNPEMTQEIYNKILEALH